MKESQKLIAMKKKFYMFCLFALCVGFLFLSCLKEETVLIDETNDETITGNSVLGQMLVWYSHAQVVQASRPRHGPIFFAIHLMRRRFVCQKAKAASKR